MNTLKDRLLTNWHIMRIIRLGMGIMMLVMGIQSKDWLLGLFSTFFLYQAVTDTGCCGSQGCAPARPAKDVVKQTLTTDEHIEYEEIK
jgi:hypothetical protein